MKIEIELDHTDFELLRSNTMAWAGLGWEAQADRFSAMDGSAIDWGYMGAYWFDDAPSMILARAYLDSLGASYQVLSDEADDGSPYVITTDSTGVPS